jgi:hypothetical protein
MTLTDADRQRIETFAKDAAMRHHQQHNQGADEEASWRFALRAWRQPEFLEVGLEIVAIWIALDEKAAAPSN